MKNSTHIQVTWTSNNRLIMVHDLCCCLLSQCEALYTCTPLGLSDLNKMVLWPGCEGYSRCKLHKRNVGFVVKRKECCCNLSVSMVLNVQHTTNGLCMKNYTHIQVARTSNNRVILAHYLYCSLLPQCDALLTSCSDFLIAVVQYII